MTTATDPTPNPAAVEAFGEKLMGVLNSGALGLMISVGHRTGLFDAMANMEPADSAAIAKQAGLQERYVREWLGAMVTGGIVNYEPDSGKHTFPPEHAALLTRAAVPDNMAPTMQFFSVLGSVEDRIVESFRNGGGVHYCHYTRFHEVMAEESAQTVVAALKQHILPLVPDLIDRLEAGIDVLDVGCGSGRALNFLAGTFPNSRFTGYDFSEEAIERGRREAADRSLKNVTLAVQDAAAIPDRDAFDLITAFDAIHDQAEPAKVLECINAALKADGTFLMQDIKSSSHVERNIANPIAPFLYTISCMHCMTVSLAQGGAGLGACWGKELACEMLGAAGFSRVEVQELDHDIINYYYIAQK